MHMYMCNMSCACACNRNLRLSHNAAPRLPWCCACSGPCSAPRRKSYLNTQVLGRPIRFSFLRVPVRFGPLSLLFVCARTYVRCHASCHMHMHICACINARITRIKPGELRYGRDTGRNTACLPTECPSPNQYISHIDLLLEEPAISGASRPAFTPWAGTTSAGPTGARCLPAPKGLYRGPGRLGWVRPTTPPAAPSGHRGRPM